MQRKLINSDIMIQDRCGPVFVLKIYMGNGSC